MKSENVALKGKCLSQEQEHKLAKADMLEQNVSKQKFPEQKIPVRNVPEQENFQEPKDPKITNLKLPEGFHAERLYGPSAKGEGSWVSMTFDGTNSSQLFSRRGLG